jgi:hypothetical protein
MRTAPPDTSSVEEIGTGADLIRLEHDDGLRGAHSDEGGSQPGREDFREPGATTETPKALRQASHGRAAGRRP